MAWWSRATSWVKSKFKKEPKPSPTVPISESKLGKALGIPTTGSRIFVSTTTPSTPTRTSEVARYRSAGYSSSEAEKLAAWSVEHQASPSPEMAKEITGAKILGGGTTLQPTTVTLPSEGIEPRRQSGWESTKQVVGRIPSGFKQTFTGLVTFAPSEAVGGIGYIFEPYKWSGEFKKDKPAFFGMETSPSWRGTEIQEGFVPSGYQPTAGLTYGELAERKKIGMGLYGKKAPEAGHYLLGETISKELAPKYQEKIDVGALTFEEATSQYEKEYEKIYEKESQILAQQYSQLPRDLYETTGAKFAKFVPAAVETGALIGASVTPVGAALASGYLVTRGFEQSVTAETKLGKGLGVATVGLGLTGFGLTMRGLGRSIAIGDIQEAIAAKPEFLKPTRYGLGEGKYLDVYSKTYQFEGVTVTKGAMIVSKPSGELSLIKGVSGAYAKTYEFGTGKPIYYGAGTSFEGTGVAGGIAKGGWQPSLVSGKITPQFETLKIAKLGDPSHYKQVIKYYTEHPSEDILVGGIAKGGEKRILSFAGEVKDVTKTWKTPRGIVVQKGEFTFDVEQIALTKIIKAPSEKGYTFIGGGGRGSSKAFLDQLYSQQFSGASLAEKATTQIIKQSSLTKTRGISGIVTGARLSLGLKTGQKESSRIPSRIPSAILSRRLSRPILEEKVKTKFVPMSLTMIATIPILKQRQVVSPILKTRVRLTSLQQPRLQPFVYPFPTASSITAFKFPFPKVPIIPFFPSLDIGRATGGRRLSGREFFRYAPSYAAWTWKIRGAKTKGIKLPSGKEIFTGLEIRKIPTSWKFPIKISKIKVPKIRLPKIK